VEQLEVALDAVALDTAHTEQLFFERKHINTLPLLDLTLCSPPCLQALFALRDVLFAL
jgi:hypothetical protein